MLCLSRNVGQCIIIDHDVTVRILKVTGKQVQIGIEAPKTVQIDREEVYKNKLSNPTHKE